ncbi:MAG: GspH/FimT family protein [Deltaproteobacteria bacterium]|nr:GspH/FimT family protein [Deltaproteobacteria bacterium]
MRGLSLAEVLFTLVILFLLFSSGISNFKLLVGKNKTSAEQIVSFLNMVRGMAISQTRHILVAPTSNTQIRTYRVSDCRDVTGPIDNFSFVLPAGAFLQNSSWRICFNSKGLSDASGYLTVIEGNKSTVIEVALGGVSRLVN